MLGPDEFVFLLHTKDLAYNFGFWFAMMAVRVLFPLEDFFGTFKP